jgi:four helix bundle protein
LDVVSTLQEAAHMSITSYRDLEVWRHSMELARRVYAGTELMAWRHRSEIGGQMRRACVSVPSNLAEGFRQGSVRAYLRHVRIAAGSIAELEAQVELATGMELWSAATGAELQAMTERAGRMLTGLAGALEKGAPRTCPSCRARRPVKTDDA